MTTKGHNMLEVVATYDNKSSSFSQPICFPSLGVAKEHFEKYLESKEAQLIVVVEYELFHLGQYDPSSAKFNLFEAPKHLTNMRALIKNILDREPEDMEPIEESEEQIEPEKETI